MVRYGASAGFIGKGIEGVFANNLFRIDYDKEKYLSSFLYYIFKSNYFQNFVSKNVMQAAMPALSHSIMRDFELPLPPLSIQQEIVTEIEGYQKIIDGAKMVVENYKPKIEIDPEWEMVDLGDITDVISGYSFDSGDFKDDNPIKCIKITNVGVREFANDETGNLPTDYLAKYDRFKVNTNDLVISLTRTIISSGLKVAIVPKSWDNTLVNQRVAAIKSNGKANLNFIYYYLCSDVVFKYVEEKSRSLMQPNLSVNDLKKLTIPCPTIETQNELVILIEKEQELVNANKQLIKIFEQKIKDRIGRVWGGSASCLPAGTALTTQKEYKISDESIQIAAEP